MDVGQGYWAFADASGHKLIPIDEGGSAGATVPYGSSLSTILGACTGKDNCRAIATDERQTSWMKTTECMSPCFRRYGNWYMAFHDGSPSPFNPDRTETALREPIFHFTFDGPGANPVNRIDGKEASCVGGCAGGSTPLQYEDGKVGSRALDTSNGARMIMGPIDFSVSAHFSVCAWLKANSHRGWQTAVGRWSDGHGGIHILHLGLESGGVFAEYGAANGGHNKVTAPAGTMAVGRWTHVCEAVSTGDGGKKQMWIDGELAAEVTNEGAAAYANRAGTFDMVLGDKCETCSNTWDGAIDDVKMWDVAITQEEAKAAFEG